MLTPREVDMASQPGHPCCSLTPCDVAHYQCCTLAAEKQIVRVMCAEIYRRL